AAYGRNTAHGVDDVGAVEELHGEEGRVFVRHEVVELDEIRMRHAGERPKLLLQSNDLGRGKLGEGLQRDFSPHFGVERAIDHAHAALAEDPDGAVPLRARERACLAPSRPRRAPGRHLPGGRVLRSVRRPSVRPQASLATTTLWRPVSDFTRPDGMAYYPRHVGREFGRLADPSRARSLPPAPRLGASRRDRAIPRGG